MRFTASSPPSSRVIVAILSSNLPLHQRVAHRYISTMGAGVEAEFWSFAGSAPDNDQNEPFLDWIYLVSNTSDADVPKIFSTRSVAWHDCTGRFCVCRRRRRCVSMLPALQLAYLGTVPQHIPVYGVLGSRFGGDHR